MNVFVRVSQNEFMGSKKRNEKRVEEEKWNFDLIIITKKTVIQMIAMASLVHVVSDKCMDMLNYQLKLSRNELLLFSAFLWLWSIKWNGVQTFKARFL